MFPTVAKREMSEMPFVNCLLNRRSSVLIWYLDFGRYWRINYEPKLKETKKHGIGEYGNTCTHRQWKVGYLLSNSDHKSYQVRCVVLLCKTHYQKDKENMWSNQGKETIMKREQLQG